MKIFLDGKDNLGWSLDNDYRNIQESLKRLGLPEARGWMTADIIHNICWNTLLPFKKFYLCWKRNLLATTSNFIDLDNPEYSLRKEFEKVNHLTKAWIVAGTKQKNVFEAHGVRAYYQPFYLDLTLFKPLDDEVSRREVFEKFRINPEIVKNKVIIGSFQRDSLGENLNKPKWQKGPELLIEMLRELPKDQFLLFLAGPRRHYVINECKKYSLPYYYIGKETPEDDVKINALSIQDMPYLYYLTDIYLVTSVSEGGPKAILEATATKTCILSTDVGLAADFLKKENVLQSKQDYKKSLYEFVTQFHVFPEKRRQTIEQQYQTCLHTLNYQAMDNRLFSMYTDILSAK